MFPKVGFVLGPFPKLEEIKEYQHILKIIFRESIIIKINLKIFSIL